jgi:hypothetical protein
MQINMPQPTLANILLALVAGFILLLVIAGLDRGALIREIDSLVHRPLDRIESGRVWKAWLVASATIWVVVAPRRPMFRDPDRYAEGDERAEDNIR